MTALKVHKGSEDVVGNALTALQILCSYSKVTRTTLNLRLISE